jgi:hypothetical protein
MEDEKPRCPKCGCFLKIDEIQYGEDGETSENIVCNNKKCDWDIRAEHMFSDY